MDKDSVSIERLSVNNYSTWSMRMKALLIHKGLWTAVESVGTTAAAKDKDEKALSLIILHVADHHLSTLATCETAKEAWDKLSSLYQSKNNARQLHLRQELNSMKKDAAEPLAKYFDRARSLWLELLAGGHKLTESEVVCSVLAGLPKDYSTVVAVLTSSEDDLELDPVLAKLMTVERQMNLEEVRSNKALSARHHSYSKECWVCGSPDHLKVDCPHRHKRDNVGPLKAALRKRREEEYARGVSAKHAPIAL